MKTTQHLTSSTIVGQERSYFNSIIYINSRILIIDMHMKTHDTTNYIQTTLFITTLNTTTKFVIMTI